MKSTDDFERLTQLARAIDPRLVDAIDDVDLSLLADALALTPFERLHACSEQLRSLTSFVRVSTGDD